MAKTNYIILAILLLAGMLSACQKKAGLDLDQDDKMGSASSVFNPYPASLGTIVFEVEDPLYGPTVQSPSILILPNGHYLVSFFSARVTSIYRSKDKGKTWESLSRIEPSNFGTLFEHNGDVYLMGTSAGGRANITIYKSTDQGKTWTIPNDENSGLLFTGLFHTAPVSVVKHNGKIWRAYEEVPSTAEDRDFHAFAVCADEDADLLKASSWKRTNSIRFDESWINARRPNWLEGNIVVTPEGKLINFMRLETLPGSGIAYDIQGAASGKPRYEVSAFLDIDPESMTTEFRNEPSNYVHFPGAETKFTIRYDPISELYWTITNKITNFVNTAGSHDVSTHQRNMLVLMRSTDLVNWEIKQKILRWNEGAHLLTWDTFGFQYVDWQFEGNDIVFVSRTSWYGKRFHDANMITFHRVPNFRNTTGAEPEDLLKYTQHPKLFDIPVSSITDGQLIFGDFEVSVSFGEGVVQNDQGEIRLKNQLISADEKQAMAARRYLDIMVENDKVESFSLETLGIAAVIGNNRNFRLKWMYSTDDGKTFLPITGYLHRVGGSVGVKFETPLYLQIYRPLNKINGKTGAILRCVFVDGNGDSYVKFDDIISVGGRVL